MTTTSKFGDLADEISQGVGGAWPKYPVYGATRDGLAPAKENIGKNPQRYKLASPGTVFYNPMRIAIGSIALVDDEDSPGITSPDYVVIRPKTGKLHYRWFYYWFRSAAGARFIDSIKRGAVRERILFTRLAAADVLFPDWEEQERIAEVLKQIDVARRSLKHQEAELAALATKLVNGN